MLSYLHGFHAGNFADVHKHAAMRIILDHLCKKEKPFCVIDTHAGSGWYDLGSKQSAKTGEWKNGIATVQQKANPPKQMQSFLDQIAAFDPIAKGRDYGVFEDDNLTGPFYPGSPFIMREVLRDRDEMILMELHPREFDLLEYSVERDPRIHLHKRDGYEGLVGMMPPAIRRGLVLMDPSYDVKQDYQKAASSIKRAWERWENGMFMLWYPILEAGFDAELRENFSQIKAAGGVLCAELSTNQGGAKGRMRGTGLMIINPPFGFDQQFDEIGQWLCDAVKLPGPATHRTQWLVPSQ